MRTIAILVALGGLLLAQEKHEGKPTTVIGYVVDTGCYVHHDSKGPDHAACAKACARAGVPLAILDDYRTTGGQIVLDPIPRYRV